MLFAMMSWVITGAIVGFIASKVVNLRGDDPKLGIGCGALGAVAGGITYRIFSKVEVTGFNFSSILYATMGAAVFVLVWHFIRRRSAHA